MFEFTEQGIKNKLPIIMDAVMDDLADFVLAEADKNLRQGSFIGAYGVGAFDRGTLARSGHVTRQFLVKAVVFDAPHAAVVELGSAPHTPPLDALIGWVKRKIRLPSRRARSGKRRVKDSEARKIAFAIQQKIKKKGTPPRPYLRQAIERVDDALINRLVDKYTKIL